MKFLIIGGGSIGKRHIKNLQFLGYKEIACLKREPDQIFEKEFGIKVFCNGDDLDIFVPDVVVVCTPTSLHVDGIRIAKKYGCAIFMEKPLIHSEKLLNEAQDLMKNYENVFFIGFMLRFHPLIEKIKSIIDQEGLGKVFGARFEFGSFLPNWHPWEDHRAGYAANSNLGGGVINTITHELDLALFLFGLPNKIQCAAANFGKLGIDVEELAEAIFQYDDKVVTLHVDYLQKDYDRNIKIWFDEGSIHWNWHDNKVVVKKHPNIIENFELDDFDVNKLYLDEMKSFISLIENHQLKHSLDFDYAKNQTNVLLKMHESIKQKSTINFN
jgi:predicted dehydrogenase